jgi:lipopolysaccharide transport system permease protein
MPKTTVIEAGTPAAFFKNLRSLLHYRDLIGMLSYRDIRVRYIQSWLGMSWVLLNPLVSMLLLYFVFSVVVQTDTMGVPPLLFTIAGLCAWNYFSRVVTEAGQSLIGAQTLIKKIYFPRLLLPVSKSLSGLIDLIVVILLLLVMILIYQVPLTWKALWIIPLSFLVIIVGLGSGIWVAALTIRYRDFYHILPILLRIGMFISPIAYKASLVPESYQWAYQLNPLTGIMEGFRWALFETPFPSEALKLSIIVGFLLLGSGLWYFTRIEHKMADIL